MGMRLASPAAIVSLTTIKDISLVYGYYRVDWVPGATSDEKSLRR
jgi:hypothetical protein